MRRALLAAGTLVLTLVSCSERKPAPTTTSEPSPNASLLPAPLAPSPELTPAAPASSGAPVGIPADSAGRLLVREPEPPPPEPAPTGRPLPDDALTAKDAAGYTLQAAFRWADVPPTPSIPELAPAAIHDAQSRTDLRVSVDLLNVGRMRFAFESVTFPLPPHAELRARTSYYGHALVWPNGSTYRVLSPGSLRAMFAERRADVSPLLRAKVTSGDLGSALEHKTQRTTVETSLGVVTLEQTTVPGSGTGGLLLCRLLVELVGAEPTTEACRADRIPLAAHYRWVPGGSLAFVATSFAEHRELPFANLYVPPPGATFAGGQLPPPTSGVFLNREELSKFRTRAVRGGKPGPRAPGEGITVSNETSELQYLLLDGVPVAWVRPKSEQYVIGPLAGKFSVAFRDFLGTSIAPPTMTELPAFVQIGAPPDAGAR